MASISFSHHPQSEIWAQFYKVEQTELNICLFTRTKENVNMINIIFQLFYIILQQPPGLHQWNDR